ncbi:Long-chain base-1-phosphate phosphatase [Tilletia horrida]|nr:Long-chain base-1-phosphate phosphatase [Tilletia horrida]
MASPSSARTTTGTGRLPPSQQQQQQQVPTSPRIAVHPATGDRAYEKHHLSRSRNASSASTGSSGSSADTADLGQQQQQRVLSDEERDLLALTKGLRSGSASDKAEATTGEDGTPAGGAPPIQHAGTLPAHMYDAYLPSWVAWLRRGLMKHLATESRWIAKMQHKYRTPRRDRYFVSTALLGTHSFFLIFLPLSFWLGSAYFGRGLINVLAMGVYLTSALKDLVCVPRPLSPPVVRLSVGTHHLEYGFPSTHSANAVSIALYCYLWVAEYRSAATLAGGPGSAGWFDSWFWEVALSYYALSVVGGRIYAGMHSLTDCVAGSIMGALITVVQWWLFPLMERCLIIPDWRVPAFIIPVGLVAVTFHPQPMDDCPCFEDAIAFIAVMMGVTLGRWFVALNKLAQLYDHPLRPQPFEPYNPSAFFERLRFVPDMAADVLGEHSRIVALLRHIVLGNKFVKSGISAARTAEDGWAGWALRSIAMFVVGSVVILLVRIVVKAASKLLLPPTFRLVYRAVGFALPRRFYTPAQEYERIPQDLRPIPSVLDLSSMGKAVIGGGGPFEPNRALSPSPSPSQSSQSMLNGQQQQALGQPLSPSRVGSPLSSGHQFPFLRAASPQPYLPRASSPLARLRQTPATGTSSALADPGASTSVPSRRAQFALGGGSSASGEMSLSASLSSLPPARSGTATPPLHQQQRQGSIVEYPLGANVPVPLTQTQGRQANGLEIPGEHAPEKIVGALKGDGVSGKKEIKRYDADVLTKVLTYSAIGLVASALLPVFFEHIGWIRP